MKNLKLFYGALIVVVLVIIGAGLFIVSKRPITPPPPIPQPEPQPETKNIEVSDRMSEIAAESSAPSAPFIKVISPNGGEKLEIGKSYDITWQSQSIETVFIRWINYTDNSYVYIASNIPAQPGKFSWLVPNNIKTGDRYKIEVIESLPEIAPIDRDMSDNYFSIIQPRILSVAAIKIKQSQYSLYNLENKINNLLQKHSEVDLIVTPEYLFYTGYENDPVIVSCAGSVCGLTSTGTAKSNFLKSAIGKIQNIAFNKKVNIVLGTVAEREKIQNINVSFNTQLIIDKNGKIIGKKRKTIEWFTSPYYNCTANPNSSVCISIKNSALQTSKMFSLISRNGTNFKIVPLICGERSKADFLNLLINSKADIITNSEREGDCNYEQITQAIQNGARLPSCWTWMIQDIFIKKWVNERNIIKQNGYLVSSEGGSGIGGIINFSQEKLNQLEVTNDYIYGKINIPQDSLVSSRESGIICNQIASIYNIVLVIIGKIVELMGK